jgi:flagellar biogenesis protein FliO
MGWVIGIAVVLVVAAVVRRLVRRRRSPQFDQQRLENANYSRIGQDVHNFDHRFGHDG